MATQAHEVPVKPAEVSSGGADIRFGVNEVRLNFRQWIITFVLLGLILGLTPWLWTKLERFDTGPDYRIPYSLSKDYWLYGRRLRQLTEPNQVILFGDSVVWGEYVMPDGTLSHFLNREAGRGDRFVNAGVNGLFPLAQEGLLKYYGHSLHRRKIVVQCNVLWLTSPKADLSTPKEERFNHSRLVPQFTPRIPCYRADANERLSTVVEREIPFISWVSHIQNAYFEQKSVLSWTLDEGTGSPPAYPNSYKNPLVEIKLQVPTDPLPDPQRGPSSPRHKPWSNIGKGTTRFEWVELDNSFQWQAFQRLIEHLRRSNNDVLVVLGPFNEHMLAEENQPAFRRIRDGISQWLELKQVPHVVPRTLPSNLYADASHPLTAGYELLAKEIFENEKFQKWLAH